MKRNCAKHISNYTSTEPRNHCTAIYWKHANNSENPVSFSSLCLPFSHKEKCKI